MFYILSFYTDVTLTKIFIKMLIVFMKVLHDYYLPILPYTITVRLHYRTNMTQYRPQK